MFAGCYDATYVKNPYPWTVAKCSDVMVTIGNPFMLPLLVPVFKPLKGRHQIRKISQSINMEKKRFEESRIKEKGTNSSQSNEQSNSMYQTAGILLSLKHSSLPTRSLQEGCVSVPGYPYISDPLHQFQQEKSPNSPFDLLPYSSGIFNNVLQVNSPDRVATAISYTGLNCFIPQFGDFPNGYYLQSPIPNGTIHKTNHYQITPDNHYSVAITGAPTGVMSSFPLPNPDGNFFVNGTLAGIMAQASASATDPPIDVECKEPLLSNKTQGGGMRGNKCHVCGKVYARPSTLKTHLRTHTGEKPFKCSVCFKSFAQDANLTAHLRIHSGEKPFQCTVCDRRFAQSSSVITHMRIHSGERPYKCKVCSRGFADSSTLTKHLRIHTGEKPYQCKICNMRFSQSGNLSRHTRVHKKSFQ